jgi:hypothetical protein
MCAYTHSASGDYLTILSDGLFYPTSIEGLANSEVLANSELIAS